MIIILSLIVGAPVSSLSPPTARDSSMMRGDDGHSWTKPIAACQYLLVQYEYPNASAEVLVVWSCFPARKLSEATISTRRHARTNATARAVAGVIGTIGNHGWAAQLTAVTGAVPCPSDVKMNPSAVGVRRRDSAARRIAGVCGVYACVPRRVSWVYACLHSRETIVAGIRGGRGDTDRCNNNAVRGKSSVARRWGSYQYLGSALHATASGTARCRRGTTIQDARRESMTADSLSVNRLSRL